MNYTELTEAIKNYTENDEDTFVNSIPTFVKNAERFIYNSVRLPALRKNVTANTTSSNKYLSSPSDFLAVFEIAIIQADGTYEFLLPKDVSFIRQNYPDPAYVALPKYYAIFDEDTFILGPTPNSNFSVELHYYYYPETIVTANTSYLGDNFDQVLLYGALIEAYTFLKGEPNMMKEYKEKFGEYMQTLVTLANGKLKADVYRNSKYFTNF
tara:strand:- start:9892 stop:10524 length:633 start_codon:yes stop_codon:yes gene_type:complete